MKIYLRYIIVLLFILSCRNEKGQKDTQTIQNDKPIEMDWFIRKFGLPYDKNLIADSNTLILYKSKNFDTSFLIHLQRRDTVTYGVYYEILPEYHKSADHYLDQKTKLIYFEGYSFQIGDSSWRRIISTIPPKIIINNTSQKNNEACFDCPHYFVAYNFIRSSSNNINRKSFDEYVLFLKKYLLEQLKEKRHLPVAGASVSP